MIIETWADGPAYINPAAVASIESHYPGIRLDEDGLVMPTVPVAKANLIGGGYHLVQGTVAEVAAQLGLA